MTAGVEAGAAARVRKAKGATSETANQVARRKGRTATSGPGQPPRKRSIRNQILTKRRQKVRVRMQLHVGCLAPGLDRFPSQNQMSNQILVPGLSLSQSLGPGPSLDLGLPPGHIPDHGQGLAPDPNLAAATLGAVGRVFCTCFVVVAQVIEVATLLMLYISTTPMVCLAFSAVLPPCNALSSSPPFLACRKVLSNPPLPRAPKLPCFLGRASQGMSTAPCWVQ